MKATAIGEAPALGDMRWTIQVLRRVANTPDPWKQEIVHTYTDVFRTRAKAETKAGISEFNRVTIEGKEVTHVFTIRYTTIPFDIRDRIRDTVGNLYQIMSIENVEQGRRWMKLHCVREGAEVREAVE